MNPNNENKPKPKNKTFEEVWGSAAKNEGFIMTPKTLLDNIGELGLKPSEYIVLQHIMGAQNGMFLAASVIAKRSDLHINTVRNAFRTLHRLQLVGFIRESGNANRYSIAPLIRRIDELAKIRQRDKQISDMGLYIIDEDPTQNSDTKIDSKNNKDKRFGKGYKHFKSVGKWLKNKKDKAV